MTINVDISQQAQQRVRVKNNSEEDAPPYAVMVVESVERAESNGELLFTVKKPDEDSARHQDPASLIFNQHIPISANGYGWGTYSSPAFAAALGNPKDDISIADRVGLAADSWKLWRGGCTHTVTFIEDTGVKEGDEGSEGGEEEQEAYGWVTPNTALNCWVRWTTGIAGNSTNEPPYDTSSVTADILYWSKPTESDLEDEDYTPTLEEVVMPQEGGGEKNLELEIYHAGAEGVAAGHGKATLLGGKWILDLAYCSS